MSVTSRPGFTTPFPFMHGIGTRNYAVVSRVQSRVNIDTGS